MVADHDDKAFMIDFYAPLQNSFNGLYDENSASGPYTMKLDLSEKLIIQALLSHQKTTKHSRFTCTLYAFIS